ncbi:MAG: NAD(P)/FAD-dependent oxidoreductase [Dehalococcoidia bacterium]|nr:NAD(P)/FAD-dependent oxidoreductase [Dehalococcoidia bacterium]
MMKPVRAAVVLPLRLAIKAEQGTSVPDPYDIIIVGGGPAGLAAALYGARGLYSTLVIEKDGPGGMLTRAGRVNDYPAHHEGIDGAALGRAMWEQAAKFGAKMLSAEVTAIEATGPLKLVRTTAGNFQARAVIVSTGGNPRALDVPGEAGLRGSGVFYCPLPGIDALAGKRVVIVGSGDSALTTAMRLAPVADSVTVVHRRAVLTALEAIQEEAGRTPNIAFLPGRTVLGIDGGGAVTGVTVSSEGGALETLLADAVVVAVGFDPATSLLQRITPLASDGHALTDEWMTAPIPGLFVAGDVRADAVGVAIAAAGDGATAAIAADHYLSNPE